MFVDPAIPPPLTTDTDAELSREIAMRPQLWRFHDEYVLGTRLELQINSYSEAAARFAAQAARREIRRLNDVFNRRQPDSELSQLNRHRRLIVSDDLFAVLRLSETWRQISLGAFDGRMGALLALWTGGTEPKRSIVDRALFELRNSRIALDPITKSIELSANVALSLDAIAKGYIVDAALNAARRAAPAIAGMAINIGGDIRCWGQRYWDHAPDDRSQDCRGWRIGIADPMRVDDNAPLVDVIAVNNAAIATSGRGPRDCTAYGYRSTTISPFTGDPVRDVISASVVASHAADADAIATACMVMPISQSIAMVNSLDDVAARVTDARGEVHYSDSWSALRLAAAPKKSTRTEIQQTAPKLTPPQTNTPVLSAEQRWPNDWEIGIRYVAPDREEERSADFRTPYMALWITDEQNRPVRTLTMVGRSAEWQRDNFIWWGINRERAEQLVDLRSQATALSGRYLLYWSGMNDDWKPVPTGKYILHIETSQERGKHTYRSLPLDIGRQKFKAQIPHLEKAGALEISYGHYNDRFQSDL